MMMMITLIWCTVSAVEMTTFGGDVTRVICSVSWRRLVNETAFNILRHRGYGEHQRDGEREREQYGDERAGWSDRIRWRRSSPTASYDCRRSTHLLTYLLTYLLAVWLSVSGVRDSTMHNADAKERDEATGSIRRIRRVAPTCTRSTRQQDVVVVVVARSTIISIQHRAAILSAKNDRSPAPPLPHPALAPGG